MPDDEIFTVDEVAAYLKISRFTIYRMLKRREFPGFKVGADWRFMRSAIAAWLIDSLKKQQAVSAE